MEAIIGLWAMWIMPIVFGVIYGGYQLSGIENLINTDCPNPRLTLVVVTVIVYVLGIVMYEPAFMATSKNVLYVIYGAGMLFLGFIVCILTAALSFFLFRYILNPLARLHTNAVSK